MDNPHLYAVLYISDAGPGAIAERFGNLAIWSDAMFAAPRSLPGAALHLIEYEAHAIQVLDLDDPTELVQRALRPSRIVSRDRRLAQAWARSVYDEKRWEGVRWWSYYDPRWYSYGLWQPRKLKVSKSEPLTSSHPASIEAARTIHRVWR